VNALSTLTQKLSSEFGEAHPIIVDGLLGSGFSGDDLDPDMARALEWATSLRHAAVLAVDCPSGLRSDDTSRDRARLAATRTLTFGAKRLCHVAGEAREFCGQVDVHDPGFPPQARAQAKSRLRETRNDALRAIAPWNFLPGHANKYDRGHVLVIGGSPGKTGACWLCGLAALRGGAGWASLAVPPGLAQVRGEAPPPELVFEDLGGKFEKLGDFLQARKVRTVVIGPGATSNPLDRKGWSILASFTQAGGGLVIDAGATHDLAALTDGLSFQRTVVTPHPGEWLRIGGLPKPETLDAILAVAQRTNLTGMTLIHKNATPIFWGLAQDPIVVGSEGTKILARAGSGDVYAGLVAAHLTAGMDAMTSALRTWAVLTHAAQQAAREFGSESVLASDLTIAAGRLMNPQN
jgi:hydroxyethylthiazole kinase-like uncharacterized protein yjeF